MILFIGDHPRGHGRAFHPSTKPGRVLREMVADFGIIDVGYLNLFISREKQDNKQIGPRQLSMIIKHISAGDICVALGKRVQKALKKFDVKCLPHPGARRKVDLDILRKGIEKLSYG